jgi:mono/diheme cytochrome c family protein
MRTDPERSEEIALGERLYAEHCASCHGAELEGQPNWRNPLPDGRYPAPPHDASGHTWHHDDAFLFRATKFGGQAMALRGFLSGMPAFADTLTDAEISSILTYIKSRWPLEIRARQARAHL